MSNNYHSVLVALQDLIHGKKDIGLESDIKFNIPIYQRLYVWKEDQVKRLLEDTFSAFESIPDNYYYLGSVIVVKNGDRYDLIDGQQRFTTLWLIAQYLKESLEVFLTDRMHFSIREHANQFFKNKNFVDNNDDELKNIKDAIQIIEVFFKDKDEKNKTAFSEYLYDRIKLVFTTVPQNVDLNKLFETINSGGIQLQHHELLKAQMLEQITNKSTQSKYSKLWDSCAFMDNYIENNLAVALNCTKTDIYSKLYQLDRNKLENFKDVKNVLTFISSLKKVQNQDKKLLKEILEKEELKKLDTEDTGKDNEIKVRSIISFSMLLLHTLRIFFKQKNQNDIKEISEKELLKIFTYRNQEINKQQYGEFEFTEKNVIDFIKLLWRVRFAFDEHIIKWVNVEDNSDEVHLICKIIENKSSQSPSLQRDDTEVSKSFSLLQSMLYHTQEVKTHYWLTPLLYKLIENDSKSKNEKYLQCMDNYLFFPKKEGDLRTNTWDILGEELDTIPKLKCNDMLNKIQISQNLGTSFPHYLFYKVEYILWFLGFKLHKTEIKQDKNFYFRAKNSVEHIEPQTKDGEKYQNEQWSGNLLNSFGNLALVSRERNSEFGNLTFKEKKAKFNAYKDVNQHLKMSMIYVNESWTDETCKEHLAYLLEKIESYVKCVK
ncbi:MAG: DUF262 domain-containing HNH endonuclease family protein [Arcobacteraceae bacterium]|jgi:uncharacterized protein with ParB-like and HNH nuclease domain|nr:DUF262 domain-containing HNH endonuclease family protein [Arcobacteraceae bacterium]